MDPALRDFVVGLLDQAPALVAETIRYATLDALLGLGCAMGFLALAVFGLARSYAIDRDEDHRVPALVITGTLTGFMVILVLGAGSHLTKVLTAPRLYVLERLLKAAGGQ